MVCCLCHETNAMIILLYCLQMYCSTKHTVLYPGAQINTTFSFFSKRKFIHMENVCRTMFQIWKGIKKNISLLLTNPFLQIQKYICVILNFKCTCLNGPTIPKEKKESQSTAGV